MFCAEQLAGPEPLGVLQETSSRVQLSQRTPCATFTGKPRWPYGHHNQQIRQLLATTPSVQAGSIYGKIDMLSGWSCNPGAKQKADPGGRLTKIRDNRCGGPLSCRAWTKAMKSRQHHFDKGRADQNCQDTPIEKGERRREQARRTLAHTRRRRAGKYVWDGHSRLGD